MTIIGRKITKYISQNIKNWWLKNNDYWTGLYCDHGLIGIPDMHCRSFCPNCGEFEGNKTYGTSFVS